MKQNFSKLTEEAINNIREDREQTKELDKIGMTLEKLNPDDDDTANMSEIGKFYGTD